MRSSYAGGDQPRSAADPDAAAYAEMVARQRRINARQAAADEQRAAAARALEPPGETTSEGIDWRNHPDFAESLIPVWGSAREAVADLHDDDLVGALGNGVLALSDVFLAGAGGKALLKGAAKISGSRAWGGGSGVRAWMKDRGYLGPKREGHHWAIPQRQWGRDVPNWIKNQPWNIKALSQETHARLRSGRNGKPRFNPAQRYWHGTPAWSKVATGAAVGHPAGATKAALEDDR